LQVTILIRCGERYYTLDDRFLQQKPESVEYRIVVADGLGLAIRDEGGSRVGRSC
jgi:hypothetical protein